MSTAPNIDIIRENFDALMKQRGASVPFELFEPASIHCDGHRLHLDVIATENATSTLVFVPGTSVYGLIYGDFLAALATAGLNVVSVDPRGHGQSGGAKGDYTIPELVRDARAAVTYARERFGGPVYIAGTSQGGIVAFYVAASDEKLAGAICHNAADLGHSDRFKMTSHPLLARMAAPLVRAAAAVLPGLSINISTYLDLLSNKHHEVKARLAADPLALKRIHLRALASLASCPLPKPVEEIHTPVLILHGSEDTIFPQAYMQRLYARLSCPKSLRTYKGRDHFLFTIRPAEVVPDIIQWIHDIESR